MRSPQGALYYLGELVELARDKTKRHLVPKVKGQPLFEVTDDPSDMDEHFIVSLGGTTRSIRKSSKNSRKALSLAAQLLAIHQDRSELPTTSLVNVVGG